jgi:hypothetical protein
MRKLATIRTQPGRLPIEREVVGATRLIQAFFPGYVLSAARIIESLHCVIILTNFIFLRTNKTRQSAFSYQI